jgi:cell division protease FtsH
MKNKKKILNYLPFIIVLLSVMSFFMFDPSSARTVLRYDEFQAQVTANTIDAVEMTVDSNVFVLEGTYQDGSESGVNFTTTVPNTEITTDQLLAELNSAEITIIDANASNAMIDILSSIIPFIFFGLFAFYLLQKMNMGNSNRQAFEFSKSKARLEKDIKVRFEDVAGCDEEKEEMAEIIDYLKKPRKFEKMGARIPKGILLVGRPGTGKTLLAKAVAGEADVPFYSISGSDFVEMFVGVGASRVRDMFKKAKLTSPCIIFIDEIDAVGRQRGAGMGGGHDEREQTLNQLLVEMDGITDNSGVVMIAATNRADILDPALLRPGRFDRQITVALPDKRGREAILKVHARNKTIDPKVDLGALATRTPGFSGADLENVLNEAAILCVREDSITITTAHLDEAIDRTMMGPAKKSRIYDQKSKELVAYHESGHAVIGLYLDDAIMVQKVTIIPRGQAGGYNLMTPKEEKIMTTKSDLLATITSYMGGRVAEEVFFDDVTTGAVNDFENATRIARDMVTLYGMSELGPIKYDNGNQNVFLGRDYNSPTNVSGQIAFEIDQEVRKIIDACYEAAEKLIRAHSDDLKAIANALMANETLTAIEIKQVVNGELIVKDGDLVSTKEPEIIEPVVVEETTEIITEIKDDAIDATEVIAEIKEDNNDTTEIVEDESNLG